MRRGEGAEFGGVMIGLPSSLKERGVLKSWHEARHFVCGKIARAAVLQILLLNIGNWCLIGSFDVTSPREYPLQDSVCLPI